METICIRRKLSNSNESYIYVCQ